MKTALLARTFGLAIALIAAGCATGPSYPHVNYPAAYQIQVGNGQVLSAYGPQNSNVTAVQPITVAPGTPLYYQVISPVAVTLLVYQDQSDGTRMLIGQMQGTTFNGTVTPATTALEFAFAVANANSSGTLQFTLSDQPLALAPAPMPAPPPTLPAQ